MAGFVVKKIPPKLTLGEKLGELRKKNLYTINLLSRRLFIHKKHIEAIENGEYDKLPDKIYTKNFVQNYAKFFGQSPVPFLNQYYEETKTKISDTKTPAAKLLSKEKSQKFWFATNLGRNIFIAAIILLFVSYIGYEVKKITSLPRLLISEPSDETVVTEPTIKISGQTEKEARLKINSETVILRSDGAFAEEIDLQKGLNIIKITAAKKYSKENTIYRKIIFEENTNN